MRKPHKNPPLAEELFLLLEQRIDASKVDTIDVTSLMEDFLKSNHLSYISSDYKQLIDSIEDRLAEYNWSIIHSSDREGDNVSWIIKPLKNITKW